MAYPMIEQRDPAVGEAEVQALRQRIVADGPRLPLAQPVDETAAGYSTTPTSSSPRATATASPRPSRARG